MDRGDMTAKEVRDLGYLAWKDPWAWMESMKGKRWEHLLEKEKHHFHELSSQPHVHAESQKMQNEIDLAQQYVHCKGPTIGNGSIVISIMYARKTYWNWAWSTKKTQFIDIDTEGNRVWYIAEDESAPYKNVLICEDSTGKVLWKKKNISDQLAIMNNQCYFIKVLNYFTGIELSVCHAHTGKEERLIYRENNEEKNIALHRTANRTLYFTSDDPEGSKLYVVDGTKILPLLTRSTFQIPLGKSVNGHHCVLTKQHIHDSWNAHGEPIEDWVFPTEQIQWVHLLSGLVLTIKEGSQTIWNCQSHKRPTILYYIRVGTIEAIPWSIWENSVIQPFMVRDPFEIPFMITIVNNKVTRQTTGIPIHHPISFPALDIHRFHTTSKDGTTVPFVAIKQKGITPKAQFVYVYGAYGSTTPIDWPYQSWYPLLKRKWVIVFALVRGGGDVDEAWADAARREHRHVSVDDFEAVIRASQRIYHLKPHQTAIYGRSAGGVPVGAMVSRYPHGNLMGAVFTEVPYVDVLRTTTNPDLPLTKGEYKEFGNPHNKIREFKELLSVSPINTLPPDGAPGVFVLTHVGLLDQQVLAYESFKWIQRLRGAEEPRASDMIHPKGKYVTFERKEAHVYRPNRMSRFRAIDLAIMDAWADQTLRL
jgi:uncharacterized protein (UPF0248 family)